MPHQTIRVLAPGGVLLIALVMLDGESTLYAAQQEAFRRAAILRVVADDCAGEPKRRVGTGFVWRSSAELVTTLHVVGGCGSVTAYSERDKVIYPVTITRVLPRADLVLMSIGNNASFPFLLSLPTRPDVAENLIAWGYGEGIQSMRRFTMRVTAAGPTLRENTSPAAHDSFVRAGTPSLDMEVIPIEDAIAPGLSGAPMLDANGRVRAIADGGVAHGITRVAWGIPVKYLAELADSREPAAGYVSVNAHLSAAEESRAAVYAADYVPPDAPTIKCGSAHLRKMRTMQVWDVVSAVDVPRRATATLNWLKSLDAALAKASPYYVNRYRVDVWEDLKSGAAVAVPAGREFRSEGSFCVTVDHGYSMVVQVVQVPSSTDPDTVAARFERLVMEQYPVKWALEDDQPKFFRPDGMVLKQKTFQSSEHSDSRFERRVGTLIETLAIRSGTFLGVAAVRDETCRRPEGLPGGVPVHCPPRDVMAWVPLVAAAEISTFAVTASRLPGLVEWQKK